MTKCILKILNVTRLCLGTLFRLIVLISLPYAVQLPIVWHAPLDFNSEIGFGICIIALFNVIVFGLLSYLFYPHSIIMQIIGKVRKKKVI